MIPVSKNDSWCQLWLGWKGLVRMILFLKKWRSCRTVYSVNSDSPQRITMIIQNSDVSKEFRWFSYKLNKKKFQYKLKSIHWVNGSAWSSFFEKGIILTKPFQPSQSWHQLSFFEKGIIVQNFLLSEWALPENLFYEKVLFFNKSAIFHSIKLPFDVQAAEKILHVI